LQLYESTLTIPAPKDGMHLSAYLRDAVLERLSRDQVPIRFAVTQSDSTQYSCELGLLEGSAMTVPPDSIFRFVRRPVESAEHFNAVFIVPTGIGAEIGGHAGDATPVARVLAAACDTLITHPNVVNASDINELPENALYVEGSVISRLLMGIAGVQRVRSNRVLVVIDGHTESMFVSAAINSVSAARASFGIRCPVIVRLDPPLKMRTAYTASRSAAGTVEGLRGLVNTLDAYRGQYDAVAISSVVEVPYSFHRDYFASSGAMVNPWGGVEAMLTHAVSLVCDVPSAHSPMMDSPEIANTDPGVVDARMAAEAVSTTFLHCVLKGLHRSPRIVTDPFALTHPSVLTAADVSCVVIPDSCIGLPTIAALEQGIPVIAVRENRNLMRNDLTALPWQSDQLHIVENYWEAAGVMLALKAGVAPESLRRPLHATRRLSTIVPADDHLASMNPTGSLYR
jgi:hypothetical protein